MSSVSNDPFPTTDLSPFADRIMRINAPRAYARLTVEGPGDPQARAALSGATEKLMLSGPVQDVNEARAMLAGLWLWHDWLDESHRISQSINTPTGSFWHAIMHRREGDFSNSKYWWARCRNHPVMAALGQQAGAVLHPLPADKSLLRLVNAGWNATAFVDLVEEVHDRPDDPRLAAAVALQRLEWRTLFDWCTRAAAGR